MCKNIRVSLVRSLIGRPKKHCKILKSMGLVRLDSTVEFKDTPAVRGMIDKISHLVAIEEIVK